MVYLKAKDIEDLDIISSLVQDSILPLTALSFHENDNKFRMLLNRFCWEESFKKNNSHNRVHSGIYFHHIKKIKANAALIKHNPVKFLSLLAIHGSGNGEITLVFSENRFISLHAEKVHVHLKDLHEPWPTMLKPVHLEN